MVCFSPAPARRFVKRTPQPTYVGVNDDEIGTNDHARAKP